jgi:hypothetical protein
MQLFESPVQTALDFYLWGWMDGAVYNKKKKVDTPYELLARILYAAVCIKIREDQLKNTRTSRTEVDCGIYELSV